MMMMMIRECVRARRGSRRRRGRTGGKVGWARGPRWRRRWWSPWARKGPPRRCFDWARGERDPMWRDTEGCPGRARGTRGGDATVALPPRARKTCIPWSNARRSWWRNAPAPPNNTGTSFFSASLFSHRTYLYFSIKSMGLICFSYIWYNAVLFLFNCKIDFLVKKKLCKIKYNPN